MPDSVRAHHTLQEEATQLLRRHFEDAPGPRRRVLWWDAGGHLRTLLRQVCRDLDVAFVLKDHPLKFRQWVAAQGETPEAEPEEVLWYIPEAEHERDWFRDVKATKSQADNNVIKKSIEDLAADLYGIQSWQLRPWEAEGTVSESVANILENRLINEHRRPALRNLQGRILTGDDSEPAKYILREGWNRLPSSEDAVSKIRILLKDEGVPHLNSDDGPESIVKKVRSWCVAGWLSEAGIPSGAFPSPISESHLRSAHHLLKSVLSTDPLTPVLSTYQEFHWQDIVDTVDEPWTLAECPVEGALEERLWIAWHSDFEAERFEVCAERAKTRADALRSATGRAEDPVGKSSPPIIRVWQQAAALADLAHRYETWDDRDAPAHALYADREEGSWQIDAAVRQIIVSGTPEDDLPRDHPARASLSDLREQLVEDEYLGYLRRLGDKMEQAIEHDNLLSDALQSSVDFWPDHKEELASRHDVLFYYLDALRLDLAYELADQLRDRSDASDSLSLNVEESTRLGTLPSETKFGMAAVLPRSARSFVVRMDDGTLEAYRNGRTVTASHRRSILDEEGWSVAPHNPQAWEDSRVVSYSKEIDDYGESSMDDIEAKLAARVKTLADEIFERMKDRTWTRAYVVTDHGFVLLPEKTEFEVLPPPDGDAERRRVAGDNVSDDDSGLLLTRDRVPDLSYLGSPVRVLLDPQQRFGKQGITDKRYYHGGALPQECVLSFLKIEAA